MPNDTHTQLRIWQQNMNKSLTGQIALVNEIPPADFDIIAIQEPGLDHLGYTRANPHWTVVYPHDHLNRPDTLRSILLVNNRLSTNSWSPIAVPHMDISAISIACQGMRLHIFNIYLDQDRDTALHAIAKATRKSTATVTPTADNATHHIV